MNIQNHFLLLSAYNQRMNIQIYQTVNKLSEKDITEDRGAFFKSILGTLNHILVGDLIWLTRFSTYSERYVSLQRLSSFPKPVGLDDMVFSSIESLFQVREKVDSLICSWIKDEAKDGDFNGYLEYANMKGVVSKRDFGELVSHLFNHQTHHRGQVTTLLNQMGHDVGMTDFLFEIPDNSV